MHAVLECILDGEGLDEFQPDHAPEMICGTGFIDGMPVGVIANRRGMFKSATGGRPASAASSIPRARGRWRTSSRR